MAKYQKTIQINDESLAMLRSGELTLQCGQWIQLAWLTEPSRWIGVKESGTVLAVHCYKDQKGNNTMDGGNSRFQTMCNCLG